MALSSALDGAAILAPDRWGTDEGAHGAADLHRGRPIDVVGETVRVLDVHLPRRR